MVLARDAFPDGSEVVLVTNKRESDKVHTFLEAHLEVITVFLGECRHPQVRVGKIDSFAGGHRTADKDRTEQPVALDLADLELDEAVGKEDPLTRADVFEQEWITDGEDIVFGLPVDTERNRGPCLKMNSFFGELTEPDLGASQILEDANLAAK
jgi:hypothetical protein